ncbi:hypothetical protein HYX58_04395 [Candidatus Dependentiae bacterium]|nr:hypothetical protein [Candidatus Dependentiae bacterium]
MQAIEFVTKAKDGVIKIPKEYIKTLHDEFRVIILVEPHVTVPKKKKKLTSLKVKTKGLVFDRDEANER